jgi:hypothetical protein
VVRDQREVVAIVQHELQSAMVGGYYHDLKYVEYPNLQPVQLFFGSNERQLWHQYHLASRGNPRSTSSLFIASKKMN